MSSEYEHTIANTIEEETGDEIRSYRCGYSGNSKHPQPDVLLTTPSINHALELKGPIQSEACYVDGEDLEQLAACENGHTTAVLVVKFSRREPMVVRYFGELSNAQKVVDGAAEYEDMSIAEKFAALAPASANPRVTKSGRLALDKPSTDDWPSARGGSSDEDAILSGIGVPTDKSIAVE